MLGTLLGFAGAVRGAPAAEPPAGFVHADGTRLRDGAGREIQLRGVNLGGWLDWEGWIWGGGFESESTLLERLGQLVGSRDAQKFHEEVRHRYMTDGDIARIASIGLNAVRVPINYRLIADDAPGGGLAWREAGWRVLDDLLAACERHGVYAVLDLHAAPGGQSRLFMADPAAKPGDSLWNFNVSRERTVQVWRAIAQRYRDRRIVAGYDLLNEPIPPNGLALAGLYKQIIAAVRAVDSNHLVILEGSDFAKDFSMFDGPLTANEAYSFHIYTWFGDDRAKRLDQWHALSERQNIPLWNGEFGENSQPMIRSTVQMFDDPKYGVCGYCFWTWKKAPNKSAALASFAPPATWKRLMRWLAFPLPVTRPKPEEARQALGDFLSAVDERQLTLDPTMAAALTPNAPR